MTETPIPVPQTTTTGPEMARLLDRLTNTPGAKLRKFAITRGDGAATPEEIAHECNSAFDQVAAGTARRSETFREIVK